MVDLPDPCHAAMQAAAGRPLSLADMKVLEAELKTRIREREVLNAGESHDQAVRAAADSYAKDMAAAATIAKRNSAINLRVRLENYNTAITQFPNDAAQAMQALQVGTTAPKKGARRSAAQEQNMLRNTYVAGFFSDVEKAGLWKPFVSGTLDRDVTDVLEAINRETELPITAPKEAETLARIIAKWEEKVRLDANAAGAWIKKLEGFIVPQSHDPYKIGMKETDYIKWRDYTLPRLDAARTFGDQDPEAFLRQAWVGLSSGVHMAADTGAPTGLKGAANIARKVSEHRKLHFKPGQWFDYNQKYGMGGLNETVLRMFEHSAMSTGLMRRFGPNARANRDMVADQLKRQMTNPAELRKFEEALGGGVVGGYLNNQWMELDGTTKRPVSQIGARIGAGLRAWQSMAKMGGVLLSQFGDLPMYASDFKYQDGSGYLSGIADALAGMMRGRGSAERRELAGMIGVVADSMTGQISSRFWTFDDAPGMMSKGVQLTFKYGGATWWTDSLRRAASESMAHRLAMKVGKSFDALGPDLTRTLGMYGIGEQQWDIIRQAETFHAQGRGYVVPEAVENLPDAVFEMFLKDDGIKPTSNRIAKARREVADQLRTYYVDRAEIAVISPDQATRAMMLRGTRPGSVEGEIARTIGQFKSFMFAYGHKAVSREVYGRGANSFMQAMTSGNGEFLGLAQLILWTTAFGYISMSAKQLAKGKEPRWPDDPAEAAKIFGAAMVQGGGFGLYGDFLFGEVNRFGQSPVTTALGPVVGAGADLQDLWVRALHGEDTAAKALRTVINNSPGLNLFYSRVILDYLFLNRLQETVNPGALRRLEKRTKKETGQDFLLRPSHYAGAP